MNFKPTLAVAADLDNIKFPVYASPKLDGIRCSIVEGRALTRTLKEIPNRHIFRELSTVGLNGLDGELILGSPTSKTVYNETVSAVMRHEGEPKATFYVFDLHDVPQATYRHRFDTLLDSLPGLQQQSGIDITVLPQTLVHTNDELLAMEAIVVEQGYEGLILRHPESPYKYGRSTLKEGYLLKVKRFEDSEAEIIGFEEEMFNGNDAQTNELGRTKRSTAKAGLVGKDTLGAFLVRDIKTNVQFAIGTGLTAAERQRYWHGRTSLVGGLVRYKYFPVGVKVAPRHPVFLGFRDKRDL